MLGEEQLRAHLPIEPADEITAELSGVGREQDRSRACNWTWGFGRLVLHIEHKPDDRAMWATLEVANRINAGNAEPVRVDGTPSAYEPARNRLTWFKGERWLYTLTYFGSTREDQLPAMPLIALAESATPS